MPTTVKVTTVGNSTGIVLPKELLEKLRIQKGDLLHVVETPSGLSLTPFNRTFADQMDVAEMVMREDRDILRKLAEQVMDDPIWISVELATAIHGRQLAEHGGADGVRDMGLLESALGKPRHLFAYSDPTPSIPRLAAAYAFGVAHNHAFIDGNKRTAYVVCRVFLLLNGHDMTADRVERYIQFLELAAGHITEDQLAEWLAANTRRTE